MRRSIRELFRSNSGAVAPTVALSLFGLIAAGGIAFDYARMASMDTELQSAADQAALAAASQLDGEDDACSRAAAAAANMITNHTLMANESGGNSIINVQEESSCDATGMIRFYEDKSKATPADEGADARFVEVEVDGREAFFAFTPIVGALSSGEVAAIAFAGLGEAICRVPPLMMCNPNEASDPDFTIEDYLGKGIRLVANDGGGNYGAGNFGFLAVGQGNGASALAAVLGRNGDPGDCAAGGTVTTEPGNMVSLRDALNTRFDMYQNGLNQACGSDGSLCPPSANSRKDLIRRGTGNNACGFVAPNAGNNGWYYPETNMYSTVLTSNRLLTDAEADSVRPMGYPRDTCHAWSITGDCPGGIIGSGDWDRYAYFRSHVGLNYPEATSRAAVDSFMTANFGTTTPTRYQVYAWEMARPSRLQTVDLGSNRTATGAPVCAAGLGVTPGPNQIDRRVLSVAVVNCGAEGVQGRTPDVEVTRWIDIFLIEPSVSRADRTENGDVYVEVAGETANSGGNNNFQVVRKSVPYLIE